MNQTNQKNQEIRVGFFISLEPQEEKDLREFLKANEYEEPPKGLKDLLLTILYEEDEPEEPNPLLELVNAHPEAINKGITKVGEFLFGKKKTPRR